MASDLERFSLPLAPQASRRLILACVLFASVAWLLPKSLGMAGRSILAWDASALALLA